MGGLVGDEFSERYPLHPLYGRGELRIRQRVGTGEAEQFLVKVEQKQEAQAVPAWMFDERRCARMTTGFDPQCSMAAYLALLSLTRATDL